MREFEMDLMQIVRENPRARDIILNQNIAETMNKYGITLSQSKKLHEYCVLLACKEAA